MTGPSLILGKAVKDTGLERVLRSSFTPDVASLLISLAYAVSATGEGAMYAAPIWIEDNECPLHENPPTSQLISRALGGITQSEREDFLAAWLGHRDKGHAELYCFDITSLSSYSKNNPFVEWGYNRDKEKIPQINLALLTSVKSHIPTYYEVLPGSLSDVKTIETFVCRKENRLSRRYSLRELMLRLGSYRKTRFSGRYGEVVSTLTKAQREIFTAFGIEVS